MDEAAHRLQRFFAATAELVKVLARATGRSNLSQLEPDDLTTFDYEMHKLAGVAYGGVGSG